MKYKYPSITIICAIAALLCLHSDVISQTGSRVGTTAASFLEFSFDAVGNGIGEAQVCTGTNLTSIYFNPANLGYMSNHQVQATYLPWILDINSSYIGAGFNVPEVGSFALSFFQTSFGEEPVTTVTRQEGTGEMYDGQDLYVMGSFARQITHNFTFGASIKYVYSRIWHETASAVAFDLGAIVNTNFFSWTGKPGDGLNIGMSIANYGTRMQYDGIDMKETVDIEPDEEGNYGYTPARYEANQWELPLIARIGISLNPLVTERHRLTITTDFLHPNNNSESINLGGQYAYTLPGLGRLFLRGGYKGLYMKDSQYGLTLGFGLEIFYLNNNAILFDYAFKDTGILGGMHAYTLGLSF